MGELYRRKVVLDIIPITGMQRRIQDLRIQFKIEKTNESSTNKSEISIFNLSQETRSLFEAKGTRVHLSIGYLGLSPNKLVGSTSNVDLVFVGDITKIDQSLNPPDLITKIISGDGDNRHRNAKHTRGYPPNTKLLTALNNVSDDFGLSRKVFVDIPDITIAHGLALRGLCRNHMDTLTQPNGLEWSIQDDALQVIPVGGTTSENPILLNKDTGLIGSPKKGEKGKIEFTSLIQPGLKPGRKVQIQSDVLSGFFKIRKVIHDGDSQRGTFLSKCEAT